MLIEKQEYKGKVIGICQVCKKEIYEHEPHILGLFHEKCLLPIRENSKYIVYLTPTNGVVKVRKRWVK